MEITLRCAVPDRPGALAVVAGAIGGAGGDIAAVDVVETASGMALDDIVVIIDPADLRNIVDTVRGLEGVDLVHAGPSRGQPGDAVSRLALGLESLLNGAMTVDHAVTTLVGGLLGATAAELVPAGSFPPASETVIALEFRDQLLVVTRDYRFTATERERAETILRTCLEAARALQASTR